MPTYPPPSVPLSSDSLVTSTASSREGLPLSSWSLGEFSRPQRRVPSLTWFAPSVLLQLPSGLSNGGLLQFASDNSGNSSTAVASVTASSYSAGFTTAESLVEVASESHPSPLIAESITDISFLSWTHCWTLRLCCQYVLVVIVIWKLH